MRLFHRYLLTLTIALGAAFGIIFVGPQITQASASFYVSPATGTYRVGDTVSINLMINTGGQAINAGEGSVTFSSNLEYQSVSTNGSIFTFWTAGPSGSQSGISFGGGLSNPGYNGSAGRVFTMIFKAKSNGAANVIVNGSRILANDGAGTNIYGSNSGGNYTIGSAAPATPKKTEPSLSIQSSTHPDQNKWYNKKTASFTWSGTNGVSSYASTFDQSATTTPTDFSKTTSRTVENIADGIWYLHVSGKTSDGKTVTSHFKVQVDTTAPDEFTVTSKRNGGNTDPQPVIEFEAKDNGSGIDHYEIIIGDEPPANFKSGDKIAKLRPGKHTIIIRAFDKAGNSRDSSLIINVEGITPPIIVQWDKFVGLLKPVSFIGRSNADDTIIVLMNGKEVGRFLSKERTTAKVKTAIDPGDVLWEYVYDQPLLPGNYSFRFQRINAAGAESTLTDSYVTNVAAGTVRIANNDIPFSYVIIGFSVLILLLLIVIIYLIKKIKDAQPNIQSILAAAWKRRRKSLETELKRDVEATIPNSNSGKVDLYHLKTDLKQEIHETLDQEDDKITKP